MAFQENSELEISLNPADYEFDIQTPKAFQTENREQRDIIEPFQYRPNPEHEVVTEFRIEEQPQQKQDEPIKPIPAPAPRPTPIVYIELYSKKPEHNQYQFLTTKVAQTTGDNWYVDPKFWDLHLRQLYKDLLLTTPYNLFTTHDIYLSFHNPEITYFYVHDKQFRLMRLNHPVSQDAQQVPQPFPQVNGTQTQFRVAVYVEVRSESRQSRALPNLGFTQAEEPFVRAVLDNIRGIRNFWKDGQKPTIATTTRDVTNHSHHPERSADTRDTRAPNAITSNRIYPRTRPRVTPPYTRRRSRSPIPSREHRTGNHSGVHCPANIQPDSDNHRRGHRDQAYPDRSYPEDLRDSLSKKDGRPDRRHVTICVNEHRPDRQPDQSPDFHHWNK